MMACAFVHTVCGWFLSFRGCETAPGLLTRPPPSAPSAPTNFASQTFAMEEVLTLVKPSISKRKNAAEKVKKKLVEELNVRGAFEISGIRLFRIHSSEDPRYDQMRAFARTSVLLLR